MLIHFEDFVWVAVTASFGFAAFLVGKKLYGAPATIGHFEIPPSTFFFLVF